MAMYEDYEDLVERLRECIAEQNGGKTLWCQATDAIDNLLYICKHQAAEIEELRKAVLRLEDESGIYDELPTFYIYPTKWIPVTERLPEDDVFVLNCNDHGNIVIGKIIGGTWWYKYFSYQGQVTHWMPLPEPPEECE